MSRTDWKGARKMPVIPGRRAAASPESITTDGEYGFRARPFGPSRNDQRSIPCRNHPQENRQCHHANPRKPKVSNCSAMTVAPPGNKRVIWPLDIRDPLKPEVVSIWGLPWQKSEDNGDGNDPMPAESAITLHGPPMIRGNRMYCAWWGGGISIINCTDLRDMQLVGHTQWSPPFAGSTHTCWPIGDKPYLVVTDEARARQKYWDSQFMWIVDARHETNPVPVSTFFPDREKYFHRPGRFGGDNIL